MTEDLTPDTPDHETSDSGAAASRGPISTQPKNGADQREWIIPLAGIGALLLAVVVFASGFAVGRATSDPDPIDSARRVVVRVDPRGESPRGFEFRDFGQRGPQGRFESPDGRPFDNLEMIPEQALDRLCGLLDSEMIPPNAPFVDRLTELCDSQGT